ncbi:hypothetical protein [Tardiphaga sp. 839_C3_N1_4]|jgi:hypothetical protein|uniref:hypothetical protein n=1 Tax=Tardiphaga sp. 839_C3_N1_4 TaxID=3240761 RepID=UPI003F231F3D
MADKHDKWADTLSAEHSGWLTGFLAEEDKVDRRLMWRLGSWGVAAVGAVVVAILASQSQVQLRRDQVTTSEAFARQSQQIQFVAKETQAEARRLTLAIETLNSDRDRLYARVTSVEQGLDSVTGSIKRQTIPTPTAATTTPAPQPPVTASVVAPPAATEPKPAAELPSIPSTPVIGPVAVIAPPAETTPAKPAQAAASSTINPPASTPLVAWKSMTAPPDAAAAKLSEPASTIEASPAVPETTASVQPAAPEPAPAAVEAVATPVARTEFGVDIGGANSVDGLRAIWRGMSKSRALNGLRPIMMVKERPTGLGMQLRLVAGPLSDAAAAAKICAALTESSRPCETSIFDGQRLAAKAETAPAEAAPVPVRPAPRRRAAPKPQERTEQAPPPKPVEEVAPPKPQSSLTSLLGLR